MEYGVVNEPLLASDDNRILNKPGHSGPTSIVKSVFKKVENTDIYKVCLSLQKGGGTLIQIPPHFMDLNLLAFG